MPVHDITKEMADPSQRAAVRHFKGPCLITAGPGSGKTYVLVRRVLELVKARGVSPGSILVLTFSRNAAVHMQQRYIASVLSSHDSSAILNVRFSTFHSYCYSLLKEHYHRPPGIIGGTEKTRLLEDICRRYALSLPAGPENGSAAEEFTNASVPVRELERLISLKKNSRTEKGFAETAHFQSIYQEYCSYLSARRLIDLDDLQLLCLGELQKGSIRPDIHYLLVDEFQDVSPVQFSLACLLAGPERSFFAVGDEDQSIYGFRGSDPAVFRRFQAVYPDAVRICLGVNYRCAAAVTGLSVRVIRNNRSRQDKRIVSGSGIRGSAVCAAFASVQEEYRAIAGRIRKTEKGSVCVLVRTVYQANAVLQCLKEEGIRTKQDQKRSPEEEAMDVIRTDLLCYLRVSMRIGKGGAAYDDLERILNRPERKLRLPYAGPRRPGRERLVTAEELNALERTGKIPDPAFFAFIGRLTFAGRLHPPHWIRFVMKTLDYGKYIRSTVGPLCGADMEQLTEAVYTAGSGCNTLPELERKLQDMQLPDKTEQEEADGAGRTVSVLTMHSAKGMEFDTVFMPDLNEGIIPARSARDEKATEEERRLFYVAMTRTRRRLYMSFIENEAHTVGPVSRFLVETGAAYTVGEWPSAFHMEAQV